MTDTSTEAVESVVERLNAWKRRFRSEGWLLFASQAQVDAQTVTALAAERDALAARVNELQAPRRVKALEWKLIEPHRGPHYWRAKTPFGEYDAGWSVEAWAQCIGPSMWEWSSSKDHRFLTEDDAKAACQADYERRLTSCYEATPEDATAKAVAERWEQMEGAINTLLNIWLDNGEVRDLRNSDLADFHATMKSIETARREAAIRAGEGEGND